MICHEVVTIRQDNVTTTRRMSAPAWAATDISGLKLMLINAPVLISAGTGWNGHWAENDLNLLKTRMNMQPDALTSGASDPNEALPISTLANVLLYMYRAGGEPGDALERAVKLGLVRSTDFAGGQVPKDGPVSRELFALLLSRAIGVNAAEDPIPAQMVPAFVDASAIQPKYRAAIAMMQAEGLLIGDGEGQFSPAQPLTYAQVTRTMVKVSAWTQARAAKLAGLNPADSTYLIEGQIDLAVAVISHSGGSGTFYYLTALLHDGTPVAAAFLGDRIAVQNGALVPAA